MSTPVSPLPPTRDPQPGAAGGGLAPLSPPSSALGKAGPELLSDKTRLTTAQHTTHNCSHPSKRVSFHSHGIDLHSVPGTSFLRVSSWHPEVPSPQKLRQPGHARGLSATGTRWQRTRCSESPGMTHQETFPAGPRQALATPCTPAGTGSPHSATLGEPALASKH